MGSETVLAVLLLGLFVYILMPGNVEWVLAQLASQNNCVEQPVRRVLLDYLSVSYDYALNQIKKIGPEKRTLTIWS